MTAPSEDEKLRDEVLKRMLATPPKPHEGDKAGPLKSPPDERRTKPDPRSPAVEPGFFMERNMDLETIRLECLKLAVALGGHQEEILARARGFLSFTQEASHASHS
jgi:hypothetical protein